jgi:hypothetical protein
MYRAGELAADKGHSLIKWRIGAFLSSILGGGILLVLAGFFGYLASNEVPNELLLIVLLSLSYLAGVLLAGFGLLSLLKRKKIIVEDKRVYRAFDLKNAFLFPRVIPRGGFLWRVLLYTLLLCLAQGVIRFVCSLLQGSIISALLSLVLSITVTCFALLYYISFICIPRIRDAGLSRDTLIMLFIPGISLVALVMLLATPTRISGRLSI